MNNDLISREALKKALEEYKYCGFYDKLIEIIDNAPTVEDHSLEIAQKSIELGRRVGKTEGIIESQRPQGGWIRKEDVIHSIAKQYSEHNELVPIWLSIGDMKGGTV